MVLRNTTGVRLPPLGRSTVPTVCNKQDAFYETGTFTVSSWSAPVLEPTSLQNERAASDVTDPSICC